MPTPQESKNKTKNFKDIAGKQVQDKQQSHVENDIEDIIVTNDGELRILELRIEDVKDNPYQPRRYFDDEKQKELAQSIKTHGLLNPILVYKENEAYYLVAGERRLKACKSLLHDTVKAIIIKADPEEASLIDNIQRENLHPYERALAVSKLHSKYNGNTKKVAEVISTSERTVQLLLSIVKLTTRIDANTVEEAETKLTNNKIPVREFYELTRYNDNTQLNTKFEELSNKYSKEVKTDLIERRARRIVDEMDKSLEYAKKLKKELVAGVFENNDTRLTELQEIVEEISGIIVSIKQL